MVEKSGKEKRKFLYRRLEMFTASRKKVNVWFAVSIIAVLTLMTLVSCKSAAETATPPAENTAPVIHYITAPTETLPQTTSQIDCVATDADSDNLTYSWTCTGGSLLGNGESVVWNSPQVAGSYDLNVVVTDGKGGEAQMSTTVVVNAKPNSAPIITSLTVAKEDGTHVDAEDTTNNPIWIAQWKTAVITCVAEDPDGDKVDLIWSASDGKIDGEGNTVTYIATEKGDFLVIVNAIDSNGASTKGLVYFHVPCCGEGSFGQKGT
jgi:hypothetical protein